MNIEADSVKDAYRKLFHEMKKVDRQDFSWESTNEWYTPDGEPVPRYEIDQVTIEVIDGK